MRRWFLVALGVVVLLALVVVVVGALLPAEHEASRTLFLPRSAREIWSAVTGWRELPQWRSGVKESRRLEGDRRGWVEVGDSGELPLAIVEEQAPHHLVLEIATDELPFSGTWSYNIEPVPSGAGCNVTIVERGRIGNPAFRFASRLFLDERATMTTYLTDLARRYGEDAVFVE
jgi:hypothetical protein